MAEIEVAAGKAATPGGSKVVIDGVEYGSDQLSEEARNQLGNLRVVDMEIIRLQQQLAIIKTARTVYAEALKKVLPPTPAGKVNQG